jgi:hypothetical protein
MNDLYMIFTLILSFLLMKIFIDWIDRVIKND